MKMKRRTSKSYYQLWIKKSLIRQIRQAEKHETPVRLEAYCDPKEFVFFIVDLVEQNILCYNGTDNYTQIIRTLALVVDVVNPATGKILSVESLLSYVKRKRPGELPKD